MREDQKFRAVLISAAAIAAEHSARFRDACLAELNPPTISIGPEPKIKHKAQWKREATRGGKRK